MLRFQIIGAMFDRSGIGLEIGPSYNPIVPKGSGARIEILDHLDQAGLIAKYRNESSIDVSRIEPVDYVSDGRPMSELISHRQHYDYIIASHVIEHMPDPMGFLRDCALLLKPSGVLVLVVPDRRYCFDYLRPVSTTGAILQAHRERRTRHTPGIVFDHVAYASRRGEQIAWSLRDLEPVTYVHTLSEAAQVFLEFDPEAPYAECHGWQFTPSSMRLILRDVADAGLLDLREKSFHESVGCEFFLALSRDAPGCPVDRLTLAGDILAEAAPVQAPTTANISVPGAVIAPADPSTTVAAGAPARRDFKPRNLRKRLKHLVRSLGGMQGRKP